MMISPPFARDLTAIGAHHPHVSPLELLALYEHALSSPAIQQALLDAVDELLLPAPPPRPLQATLTTNPDRARLFLIRTVLRTIQRHAVYGAGRVSLPTNPWLAFCDQADPESSPHYSTTAP